MNYSLLNYFEKCAGNHFRSKRQERRRYSIGAEFELISVNKDFSPVTYLNTDGMETFLRAIAELDRWTPDEEINGRLFSLRSDTGTITIEPGCQIEFSCRPNRSLTQSREDFQLFINDLHSVSGHKGFRFLGMGINPWHTPADIGLLPKQRYGFMDQRFQTSGTLGQYMMRASASAQVCMDFHSLDELLMKLKLGFRLTPFLRSLFASSPFVGGKLTDFLSFRSHVWNHTDPSRCGIPQGILSKEATVETYTKWLEQVPQMFYKKDGELVQHSKTLQSQIHSDYSEEELDSLYMFHIGQTFTEVRAKNCIEFRSCDAQIPRFGFSVPAFYKGIFGSPEATAETLELLSTYTEEELYTLCISTPKTALKTPLRTYQVLDVCKDLLQIAKRGLDKQHLPYQHEAPESPYLENLMEIVFENGYCPAEYIIRAFKADHQEDIKQLSSALLEY
jgi:glutamate--cysteine ligase